MAGTAILTESTCMNVILDVTGIAIAGRAVENIIDMAIGACNCCMGTGQLKIGQVVIEAGRRPTGSGVTGAAIGAYLAAVNIIFSMASLAILARSFETGERVVAGMAFCTFHLGMFAGQLEGHRAVVELVTVCIDSIVTAQAFIPIGLEVSLHEIGLDLFVAGSADGLVKLDKAIGVTGVTCKGRAIRLELMSCQ